MNAADASCLSTFRLRPAAALQPYVDRIWGWESAAGQAIALPTLLPGTGAEVFFHYRAPFCRSNPQGPALLPPAHLLCVRGAPLALRAATDVGFVAVRFRAGMLHRFVRIPAQELLDQACAVDALWGAAAAELAERIGCAVSFAERAALVQSFLLSRLRSSQGDDLAEQAVSMLYRAGAELSVARLAEHLGIGRRQLERRVKLWTGQTPAEVRRLVRFQKTVRALMLDPSARCADAALAHGYYDQAHFIHDFRELAQATPQRYVDAARARAHFYNTPWRP
ncbi:MAG TPA: helix-turn-helix domain-containing protein [Noviherbaspirillum sp.]|nr:helix-turn-helix domain-containing protein [Noviherbaspirillum sp.]